MTQVKRLTLKDQHVVIIGGSSGMGRSVAELKRAHPGAALAILRCDVLGSDLSALRSIGKIDHVFVSAGQFVGGTFVESDPATIHVALERLFGAVNSVRILGPRLAPHGSIVLTGGISTDRPVRGAWATAVSTAATEQLARSLALELAPRRVNAISPGWTDTPMWDEILGPQKGVAFSEVAQKIPTGAIATAEQAALAAIALMLNPGISGEVTHIDGGHRLT